MFKSIQLPSKEWAILLAKMLLYCIEDVDPNEYLTKAPSHIEDSIMFVNKDDNSNYIKIHFKDTNHFEILKINKIYPIWTSICYISGGKSDFFDDWFLFDDSPLSCKYDDKPTNVVELLKEIFNILLSADNNVSIKNCITEGKTIVKCYLQ